MNSNWPPYCSRLPLFSNWALWLGMHFPLAASLQQCLYKAMKSSASDNMKPPFQLLTGSRWREEEALSTPGPGSNLLILDFLPVSDEGMKK